jgi:hypothetical protein
MGVVDSGLGPRRSVFSVLTGTIDLVLDILGELIDTRRRLAARLFPLLLDQLSVVITSLLSASVDLLLAVAGRVSDPLLALVRDRLGQIRTGACVLRLGQRFLLGLPGPGHGDLSAPEAYLD